MGQQMQLNVLVIVLLVLGFFFMFMITHGQEQKVENETPIEINMRDPFKIRGIAESSTAPLTENDIYIMQINQKLDWLINNASVTCRK